MSRSGYSDSCGGWEFICWRGAVTSAIKGKRGQQFLRELLAALEAMPVHELIAGELEQDGAVCTLGSIGKQRGIPMSGVDPYDRETIADLFGIAPALAAEIMYENDDDFGWNRYEAPAKRWERMRAWIIEQIKVQA